MAQDCLILLRWQKIQACFGLASAKLSAWLAKPIPPVRASLKVACWLAAERAALLLSACLLELLVEIPHLETADTTYPRPGSAQA